MALVTNNDLQTPAMNPRVSQLLTGMETIRQKIREDSPVACLITDSRRVVPGALFFAIGGLRTDGNLYVEEAVDRGAVAIITEENLGQHFPIDYIQVSDVRKTLALVSRQFYDAPDAKLGVTGITGTNGKTTVSMLTQHLIGGQDQVGLLGTIRYDLGKRTLPSFRTTPESVDVYALLSQMVDHGCSEAVMEVSSHGIDQKRTYGVDVEVAVFLNLTQDHIDYHKSMEGYYKVKKRLFTGETGRRPRAAVINVDCAYGRRLLSELPDGVGAISFGIEADSAIIRADDVALFADRTEFRLTWPEGQIQVCAPLLGRYNVSNLLAALAIARAKGHEIEPILQRVMTFPGVPGRMERMDEGQPFNVLVDYAHTDDALIHACSMLREITAGRLIVVFGCGGDRDRSKRAPMLRAALAGSDEVFVTSDNPRTESIDQIFSDMREATDSERAHYVSDRKHAISLALDCAQAGDCVLIAGKGHEAFQEFDGTVIPFDDRQVARELIRLKEGAF
ncbi:UDP-N-acetylmuramoyl-L-alanyl-D-glutamate--2,6-diaminopimelate ligase [Coraliomargarita sp. SDUM461004]|uniref:UDP-N-acetylmuramoyl-L-alanyl-D-glutamate--2,6-diaminopimelate ligase n=1 Tax=Thalassobacterium sedimentorum TaxID=3041258 RepID=A0ABU1ALG1_9BACT|nr:UDP-N-acetylmuramoyl-L-alanyl-D-glutamate--2,6-diaminopimelate ligase [Coraliomargarita sp. SDUM461004]MDQ8194601.1 UDP-N-acetylmuramoyl-L-alanyl-D-glutamate--2,6-diaminopimelate ligase [Coraliomargarita sp. SDUM461004]